MTSEFAVAVHALVYLEHKGETVSSEALAENVCTNPARIRKVMAQLKKQDLVATKEGLNGGYLTARPGKEINLKQICEALNAQIVSATWHSGRSDMNCMVASGMAGVMDEIYGDLNEKCKAELEKITIQDIEDKIFKGEAFSMVV